MGWLPSFRSTSRMSNLNRSGKQTRTCISFFVRMYLEMRSQCSNMEIGSKMHFATNWTTVNIATSAVNVISHFFRATITQHCRILQHIHTTAQLVLLSYSNTPLKSVSLGLLYLHLNDTYYYRIGRAKHFILILWKILRFHFVNWEVLLY